MQKIINGLRYDTKKATLVAEYQNGLVHLTEKLYRTNNYRFFLYVERDIAGEFLYAYSDSKANAWCKKRGIGPSCLSPDFTIKDA